METIFFEGCSELILLIFAQKNYTSLRKLFTFPPIKLLLFSPNNR